MYSTLYVTDVHLSPHKPVARTEETKEEWLETQLDKLEQLFSYARANAISTVFCSGDVFSKHQFNNAIVFINRLVRLFNKYADIEFKTICGNHDARYGNTNDMNSSFLGLFEAVCPNFSVQYDSIFINSGASLVQFDFFQYKEPLVSKAKSDLNIALLHENIFLKTVPPYMFGYTSKTLHETLPGYNIYLCGHNHEKFCDYNVGYTVLNGGSMMRLNTSQKDFKPSFWRIDIEGTDYTISEIPFNIEVDRIDDSHIIVEKENAFSRENMLLYMQLIENANAESYDFETNLHNKMELLDKQTPIYRILQEVYYELQEDE